MNKVIAIFLDQPRCSVESINGIFRALDSKYSFKIFTKYEVEDNFFKDIDAVLFPGGLGDADTFDRLLSANGEAVKEFINSGGKYIGICMGAYWAGKHYFNLLDSVDAVQYIKRPMTESKRPHAKNIKVLWNNEPTEMFFYDGCALVGNKNNFKIIATYANGDPMAIIQKNIGLIGCHPESLQSWYDNYYSWLVGKYHQGHHHKLLLEFVDELMTE